jgi:hypothetical protein
MAETEEFESISQDIFFNFGLCEQIIEDFKAGKISDSIILTEE